VDRSGQPPDRFRTMCVRLRQRRARARPGERHARLDAVTPRPAARPHHPPPGRRRRSGHGRYAREGERDGGAEPGRGPAPARQPPARPDAAPRPGRRRLEAHAGALLRDRGRRPGSGDRAVAARGDPRRRLDRRPHRPGEGHAGVPEPRPEAHRGDLRLPGLHAGRRPRHAAPDRRAHRRGEDRAEGRGPRPVRPGEDRRQARRPPRRGAPQRLHHARRQRDARRSAGGRARLLRARRAGAGRVRARVPDRGRTAVRGRG